MRPYGALHQVTALAHGPRSLSARGYPNHDADGSGYDPSGSNRNHGHIK
jgi:hypothetical protein